ncbi:hypothetical protein GQ607_011555, partial [Colletotrichum asianum]
SDTGYIPPTESRPWGLEIGNGPRTTPRCHPFDIHCHRSGPVCNGSIDAEIITLNCVTSPADWPLAATPRETPPTSAKTCDGHGSVESNSVSTPAIAPLPQPVSVAVKVRVHSRGAGSSIHSSSSTWRARFLRQRCHGDLKPHFWLLILHSAGADDAADAIVYPYQALEVATLMGKAKRAWLPRSGH